MGLFDRKTPVRDLDRLLAIERDRLLTGQISGLDEIARDKERLLALVGTSAPDPKQLARLVAKAESNQVLLAAAANGVRAARARLEQIRTASTRFRTYGSDGAAGPLGRPHRSDMNRRA